MGIKFQDFCRGRYKLAAACIDEIWGLVPKEIQPKFLSVIHRMHSAVSPLNNMIPDHIGSLDAAIKAAGVGPEGNLFDDLCRATINNLQAAWTQGYSEGRAYSTPAQPSPEPPSEPQGDGFGIDCSPELSRAVFAEFTVSPHPAAQISDERIREIGKDVFGIDLNFDGNLITFAHALLREAAPKEGA